MALLYLFTGIFPSLSPIDNELLEGIKSCSENRENCLIWDPQDIQISLHVFPLTEKFVEDVICINTILSAKLQGNHTSASVLGVLELFPILLSLLHSLTPPGFTLMHGRSKLLLILISTKNFLKRYKQ